MSNNCDDIASILLTDGTNQSQRNETALDPKSLKIHGFGMEEWMKFAYRFAKHLNYYNTNNSDTANGNWQDFFTHENEVKDLIASLEKADNLTPHLTLFVCFLKLMELPNDRMNDLTRRHLDYYYKEVLQIEKLPATYDKVHLIFELSKVFSSQLFEKGMQFNGGKDANGKLRVYELIEEFAANKATIASLRNFYNAPEDKTDNFPFVKAAEMVQSANGVDKPLPEGETEWYPFGYDLNDEAVSKIVFDELPDAKIGFSIASDTLLLSQGDRYIEIVLTLSEAADTQIASSELIEAFQVEYTGTKKWRLLENSDQKSLTATQSVPNCSGSTDHTYQTKHTNDKKKFHLFMELPSDAHPTAPYNAEIHGLTYNTDKPIFRFLLNVNCSEGAKIYKAMRGKISSIQVNVNVQNMRDVTLENDRGSMNPTKPMFPFTTTPVVGSSFTVQNEEILSKNWTCMNVKAVWKNAPDNFGDHYEVYDRSFLSNLSVNSYESIIGQIGNFRTKQAGEPSKNPLVPNSSTTANDSFKTFKARVGVRKNNEWANKSNKIQLFSAKKSGEEGVYTTDFSVKSSDFSIGVEDNVEKIRLKLESSFYHDMYPRLYAIAVSSTESTTVLPNEPYTPFAEEIVVAYTATDTLHFANQTEVGSVDAYEELGTRLFHEHPFGQTEEHDVLKSSLEFLATEEEGDLEFAKLMPSYTTGGEFYIGLENAEEYQTIPLLFQIAEGTEDTELTPLTENTPIEWDVLCSNHWKSFDSSEIVKNEVDNFLRSGIVALKMPPEITQDNTLLPSGYTWLRAKLNHQPYDIVCKFIGIHSQVSVAQFTDHDNETSHLETGIEAGTIAKLVQRSSSVKSITQPYNSFGGSNVEDDTSYYRRVSERLRHKRRAVTIWDYEQMVLQEFTDIYRAKCLSHTRNNCFNKAGSVTMVVIPDTVNKNVFNIYEPRISTAYLNEIKAFLKRYTSPHVCLDVLNPNYEAIQITTSVRFNPGYDESAYITVLKEDLTKLLAPWAFDETKEIEFGGKLQRSMLINYIENLEYIDYIASIDIGILDPSTGNHRKVTNYEATSPLTIMVSDREHKVSVAPIKCTNPNDSLTSAHCE